MLKSPACAAFRNPRMALEGVLRPSGSVGWFAELAGAAGCSTCVIELCAANDTLREASSAASNPILRMKRILFIWPSGAMESKQRQTKLLYRSRRGLRGSQKQTSGVKARNHLHAI